MKPLSIIIITYNRPDDVLLLLKNIAIQKDAERLLESVIIIDNNSAVSYSEVNTYIATQPLPFQYIHSDENLGVARGRNKAVALAKAPIVITIDDDAYFKESDALVKIESLFASDYAKEHNVGVFCFKVFYGSTGELQTTAFPHKKIDKYRSKARFLTSYYIGCGHAIRKEVYDQAGIYPTDFFYGMEEYDLGYRILDLGYRIAYDDSVTIIHNESPLGRTPHAEKMQMLWVNKSKVAYRYLPFKYFMTTVLMWSVQFLKKTSFNWRLWFVGWNKIINIPRTETRHAVSKQTLKYIKNVEGRMWY
jgi:GT2 family glycosyltransferase